jgi:hypothetical protein
MILSQKREFAMGGGNLEIGWHLNARSIPFSMAMGPYYLHGSGKATWGGELRAVWELWDYARLEGGTAYDHRFKWTGQGQLSIAIPFGSSRSARNPSLSSRNLALNRRLVQQVERHEIIPVGKQYYRSVAIDANTGEPFVFWFVDNTSSSSSQGTFESPFGTLLAAQDSSNPSEIIYVFPGNNTDAGMDQGIALQDQQRFLGSGVGHSFDTTLGDVTVPAMTAAFPFITNAVGSNPAIITLQNGNEVSGFLIQQEQDDFYGASIALLGVDASINRNYVALSKDFSGIIATPNDCGVVTISNNTFLGLDVSSTIAIDLEEVLDQGNITIEGNLFTGSSNQTGLGQGIILSTSAAPGFISLSIVNNTFSSQSNTEMAFPPGAISLDNIDGSQVNIQALIAGNTLSVPTTLEGATAAIFAQEEALATGVFSLDVRNNVAITGSGILGYQFSNLTGNASLMPVVFSDNIGSREGP